MFHCRVMGCQSLSSLQPPGGWALPGGVTGGAGLLKRGAGAAAPEAAGPQLGRARGRPWQLPEDSVLVWHTWLSAQAGPRWRATIARSKGTHTMSRMHSRSLGANSALYRICTGHPHVQPQQAASQVPRKLSSATLLICGTCGAYQSPNRSVPAIIETQLRSKWQTCSRAEKNGPHPSHCGNRRGGRCLSHLIPLQRHGRACAAANAQPAPQPPTLGQARM